MVGDGPLRDYNTPDNQKFMKELKEGYVPTEISKNYKGSIGVDLDERL